MATENLYPVPVKTQANGHILVEDGATRGATVGINLYDQQGNLIPPEDLDARAIVAAHRTEANAHPISSVTNLQTSLDGKVSKAGDTMSGQLNASFNVPAIGAGSYSDRQYRAETTNGSYPGYGFHISGFAGAALYYTGGLNLSITDNTNTTANLWHSQNLAQPMTLDTAQNVTATKTFSTDTRHYVGAVNTQQILQTFGWNNGIGRWKAVLESNAMYKLYSYDVNGGTPTEMLTVSAVATGGTEGIWFRGQPMWHAGNVPDAPALNSGGRLGRETQFVPGDNWNNAVSNGWYMSSTAANAPTGPNVWYIGIVTVHNASWITQEVWDFTAGATAVRYRRQQVNGVWSAWTAVQRMAGDGNPGLGAYSTALTVSGAYGGGIGFVDGSTQARVYMTNNPALRFGLRGDLNTVAEVFRLSLTGYQEAVLQGSLRSEGPTAALHFRDRATSRDWGMYGNSDRFYFWNGSANVASLDPSGNFIPTGALYPSNQSSHYIRHNGSGIEVQGPLYQVGTHFDLSADAAAWVRNPRTFVQATDPGAQASDGDLWFW